MENPIVKPSVLIVALGIVVLLDIQERESFALWRACRGLLCVAAVLVFEEVRYGTKAKRSSRSVTIDSTTLTGHVQLLDKWADRASGWISGNQYSLFEFFKLFVYASTAAQLVGVFVQLFPAIDDVLLSNVTGALGFGACVSLMEALNRVDLAEEAEKVGAVAQPFFGVWTSFPALVQRSGEYAKYLPNTSARIATASATAVLVLATSFFAFRLGGGVFSDDGGTLENKHFVQRCGAIFNIVCPLFCVFVTASSPLSSLGTFIACFSGCLFGNLVDSFLPNLVLSIEKLVEYLVPNIPQSIVRFVDRYAKDQRLFLDEEHTITFFSQVLGNLLPTLVAVMAVKGKSSFDFKLLPLVEAAATEVETSFAGSASAFCGTMVSINNVYEYVFQNYSWIGSYSRFSNCNRSIEDNVQFLKGETSRRKGSSRDSVQSSKGETSRRKSSSRDSVQSSKGETSRRKSSSRDSARKSHSISEQSPGSKINTKTKESNSSMEGSATGNPSTKGSTAPITVTELAYSATSVAADFTTLMCFFAFAS